MSLFDNFLKDLNNNPKKDALPEDMKKKLEQLNSLFADMPKKKAAPKETPKSEPVKPAEPAKPAVTVSYKTASYEGMERDDYYTELPEDELDCKEKILEVVNAEWPDVTIREDISPTEIGGTGRFYNYSIGFYRAGKPILFIMLVGKKTTTHRMYRWSKEQAERAGVPMLNFIKHAPNRYWYIKERLSTYLN